MKTTKIEETILSVKEALQMAEVDPEEASKILLNTSCKFFREGNAPFCDHRDYCDGCATLEKQKESAEFYLKWISVNPKEVWDKSFSKPKLREKKSIEEIISSGFNMGMFCSNCYISASCPEFQIGMSCAVDWSAPIEELTPTNIIDYLIRIQSERVNRAQIQEKIDGGVADQNLSVEMDRLTNLTQARQNLNAVRVNFSASVEGSADGIKAGGGILSQLFGPKKEAIEEPKADRIEIQEAEVVEEKKKIGHKKLKSNG